MPRVAATVRLVLPGGVPGPHNRVMTRRANLVLGAVVGGAVVLSVIVAVATSGRSSSEFPADSPEAAVQAYLEAILDRDATALDWLADDTSCETADLGLAPVPDSARVVLVESDVDGDRATVEVEVSEASSGSPFDTYEFVHVEVFTLEQDDGGEWRITGAPWPLYVCEGGAS